MNKGDALPLEKNKLLLEAIKEWEILPLRDQLNWNGECIREIILDTINPILAEKGAVRIKLLDFPDQFGIQSLRKLISTIAKQLGFLVPQTYANNITALIKDKGGDYSKHFIRGHQTNAELSFHSDRCDLNVMLYVRGAADGGDVSIVSYEKAAKNLECRDPSALAMLFENFPFDLREERIFPIPEWCLRPILWKSETNQIRGHYIRRFIDDSQRHLECPRISALQRMALDELDSCLKDMRDEVSFNPVPGELVVLDNFRVMHARNRYIDAAGRNNGRLVIRTWVAPFNSETLPEFLFPMMGAVASGCYRGGVGRGRYYLNRLGTTYKK